MDTAWIKIYHPNKYIVSDDILKMYWILNGFCTDQPGQTLKGVHGILAEIQGWASVCELVGSATWVYLCLYLLDSLPSHQVLRQEIILKDTAHPAGRQAHLLCIYLGQDKTKWTGMMEEECGLWSWQIWAWNLIYHCPPVWPDASQIISVSHCSYVIKASLPLRHMTG